MSSETTPHDRESDQLNTEHDCTVCDSPQDEWPRDRVIVGELTRGDVNSQRRRKDLGLICSRSCMLERSEEHRKVFGWLSLDVDARFGGPGWHKL